ncbi:MlaD family protein [Mycolicibacter longobardus]|uniref:Mammalian cell entry protein n=1 Tax=Mycolicibacter longobardus TaxID=1108812 RepID=A0A1X1YDU8_9MYCO|nr:MCE family protein [Mycolicibacter longobardus]MCV7382457.1 MCE family protein [Mycolicibacter longobardus]ORW09257.1 mammalian cell entry protein [Mycolicibacter longobardus]
MSRPVARTRSIAVGLAIVAFAGGLLWYLVSGERHRTLTVTAQFEEAVGLYEGNAVSVLGMPVGKVTEITPKDSYVQVKLVIDKNIDIPADVQAVTVATSILTDRHVELTPPYGGGPKLRDGDVIGLPRTRTPVEFDRTLAMADKLSRALGGDGEGRGPLANLIGIGARISSGSGPDIKSALDQLSQALRLSSDNGAATGKTIASIAAGLADLTQAAADNDTAIREFGSNIRALSDLIAAENLGAGTTGAKANQILDQATALLEKNRDTLKRTVGDFGGLTTTLTENRRQVEEILDVLPLVGTNIYNAVDPSGHTLRIHPTLDKLMLNGQMAKEICNLAGIKDLGCATGTVADNAPEFGTTFFVEGMTGLLERMAGAAK